MIDYDIENQTDPKGIKRACDMIIPENILLHYNEEKEDFEISRKKMRILIG